VQAAYQLKYDSFMTKLLNVGFGLCNFCTRLQQPVARRRQITDVASGDHVEYEVETGTGKLFVVDPAVERALAPATEVAVGFKGRGIAIING
jgi:hypothetical protein